MNNLIGFDDQSLSLIKNYNANNLHNSIILHGPKGIGKRTFINNFIHHVLKKNFNNTNYSHNLNLFNKNSHPNIKIIEKETDIKTNKLKSSISIDQIRIIKKFVNSSPSIKNFNKIVIVDSADDLNNNSSNSFLKTLEEPNKNTFIFLISHRISSLLPTLRSRCLKIKFSSHNFPDFKKIVLEHIDNINDDDIKFFYDLTLGSPGNTIELFDEDFLEILDLTIKSLNNAQIDLNCIKLANYLSYLDNDKFKNYLLIYKSILIILNKIKINKMNQDSYLSSKFKMLQNLSSNLTIKNVIDRFEFISKYEIDLFNYNLDKKLFILKLLNY